MVRRIKVLGMGLLLGALFALWTVGLMMPTGQDSSGRLLAWTWVMGGPIIGTAWGMAEFHTSIGLGWLGAPLILAHPLRPCALTGCMTLLGFSLWFFAGFVSIMVAAWGA